MAAQVIDHKEALLKKMLKEQSQEIGRHVARLTDISLNPYDASSDGLKDKRVTVTIPLPLYLEMVAFEEEFDILPLDFFVAGFEVVKDRLEHIDAAKKRRSIKAALAAMEQAKRF